MSKAILKGDFQYFGITPDLKNRVEMKRLRDVINDNVARDFDIILSDIRLVNYHITVDDQVHNLINGSIVDYVKKNKNTIYQQYVTRYNKYGINFYNIIQEIIYYDKGVLYNLSDIDYNIDLIRNIGIHTLAKGNKILASLNISVLNINSMISETFEKLEINKKDNPPSGTIVAIIGDRIAEAMNNTRTINNIDAVYPNVTVFSPAISITFLVILHNIFPNVKVWNVKAYVGVEEHIDNFHEVYPDVDVNIIEGERMRARLI